jgi:AraC-like DNA-binding protein
VHDGVPHEGRARGWRMLYLDTELVGGMAGEDAAVLEIARPAMRDPVLAGLVARAFARATDPGADRLGVEEDLLRSLVRAMRRTPRERPPRACPAVGRARQRLDDAPEAPVSLAELARLAGVSRFQLLRGFAREVGVTPHRYLVQRRVGLARRLLAKGEAPAAAALAAGFADQSHMSRAFVRQFGITPGRYRRALA